MVGRRFIPTRVGSCRPCRDATQTQSVHPHSRGELDKALDELGLADGSSPLAWGVDRVSRVAGERFRFIPTRVGSWCVVSFVTLRQTVHPHSRGELI